jgi:hypothetical protein
MEDGADIVFHLLVPTSYAYGIEQPFVIDEAIGPLIIKGHRYKSTNLVWFNFFDIPFQVTLQCVGNLNDLQDLMQESRSKTAGTFCVTAMMSPLALLVFSPLALCMFASCWLGAAGTVSQIVYSDMTRKTPEVLGPPTFLDPGNGH